MMEHEKMLEALPYYRWMWRDWRANRKVQHMSWQARGLYRELLDEFWSEGCIPIDFSELADICGCSREEMERLWPEIEPSWVRVDGVLENPKMEAQRTAKDRERVLKANAGRRGGLACNSRTREKDAQASAKQLHASAKDAQAPPDIALAVAGAVAKQEPIAQSAKKPALQAPELLPDQVAGTLPLVDGTEYQVSKTQLADWKAAYPAVDVSQQLREMKVWIQANPRKRKTRDGVCRFAISWLSRAQDKPHTGIPNGSYQPRPSVQSTATADFMREREACNAR